MSQFENSEVMINYALLMQDKMGMRKYAWTSRDLTKALALEGTIATGIGTAGALGVGSGGATGLTGAVTALVPIGTAGAGAAGAGAAGAGAAGAGAAGAGGLGAAIVSNPVGWIVGAVLLVGGVAAAIYFATEKTDDNLRDLISRIEALDYEDTPVHTRVQSWIDTLNEKLASLTEDVDDLISLYEIVSVEMNPFVGLSKITTNRLDALENIDKEFESLKERIENLEAGAGRVKASIPKEKKELSKDISLQEDIDFIVDKALEYIAKEKKIDDIIDKFIEKYKGGNAKLGG